MRAATVREQEVLSCCPRQAESSVRCEHHLSARVTSRAMKQKVVQSLQVATVHAVWTATPGVPMFSLGGVVVSGAETEKETAVSSWESLEREPPRRLSSCYARVGMTLAHVAGGEETAGIRGAHEVGDAGVGVVRIPRGTVGRLVAGYSDVRRHPVQRKVAPRLLHGVQLPGNSLRKEAAVFLARDRGQGRPGVADDGCSAHGCLLTEEIGCQIYSGEFRHSGGGEGGEAALENRAD
ncbi:uncharacterized protein LOC142814651 [Rhipicephalus microplus]|uniref:uncharacterized protein LOC142814651 n=1 Tax=Rhipicephalus microplus TaxID=6941 RepID=UPI003F6B3A21